MWLPSPRFQFAEASSLLPRCSRLALHRPSQLRVANRIPLSSNRRRVRCIVEPLSVRRLLGILCNWTIGPQYVASGSSFSRCSPAAVRDLARAEATCDRTSMRPVISFTKGGGERRAERRVKAERVGVRGGVTASGINGGSDSSSRRYCHCQSTRVRDGGIHWV